MALNAASISHNAVEIIDGTLTEYYNLVEDAMRASEVIPGKYKIITTPSYANPCPVHENAYTTIDISAANLSVISLENSYITANLKVKLKCNAAHAYESETANPQTYFIGWKSSLDAISKYQIYQNSKLMYDQTYCCEESYVMQTIVPDHVKYTRSEQFSTLKRVREMDPNVCGTYFTLSNVAANTVFEVDIPIKIDITQFLFFQQFKYMPHFFGTWSIRVWFSHTGMVVAPVDPEHALGTTDWGYTENNHAVTPRFTQIGDPLFGVTNYDKATKKVSTALVQFDVTAFQASEVEVNVAQFEILYSVSDALRARYFTKPLPIPMNEFKHARFAGKMDKEKNFTATYNSGISCCEAMFILPFIKDEHKTICRNPRWENLYVNISGYGNFPQQAVTTYPKPGDTTYTRFLTMTLDALNINNSAIMSMTDDLAASLRDCRLPWTIINADGNNVADTDGAKTSRYLYDDTNFLVGIPFSNSEDFQGGLVSNGQAAFKISASNAKFHPPEATDPADAFTKLDISIGPTVLFLVDKAVLIQTLPNHDQPRVKVVDERLNL